MYEGHPRPRHLFLQLRGALLVLTTVGCGQMMAPAMTAGQVPSSTIANSAPTAPTATIVRRRRLRLHHHPARLLRAPHPGTPALSSWLPYCGSAYPSTLTSHQICLCQCCSRRPFCQRWQPSWCCAAVEGDRSCTARSTEMRRIQSLRSRSLRSVASTLVKRACPNHSCRSTMKKRVKRTLRMGFLSCIRTTL